MRPNRREVRRCEDCGARVFFAVTKAGERQCLNVEPDPLGTVLAYRGHGGPWLARTVVDAAGAGEMLHPLETRFKAHAATCTRRARPAQDAIPGFDLATASAGAPTARGPRASASSTGSAGGGTVVPFRSRRGK